MADDIEIPDDFDLDDMRSARSSTNFDKDEEDTCPYCTSIKVRENVAVKGAPEPKTPYYCDNCNRNLTEEDLDS